MFKDRLMEALDSAVGHFNSGLDDNASVVKAASSYDFNQDQTLRLMETYNTAKTISFLKTAEDRSQNFSTADAESVLPSLFDADEVLKSAAPKEGPDYSFYDNDKDPLQKAAGDFSILEKAAAEFDDDSLESVSHYALHRIGELKKTAGFCEDQKGMSAELYDRTLQKIARALKPGYMEESLFPQAEVALHIMYKDAGDHMAEEIMAYMHPETKRATARDKAVRISTFDVEHSGINGLLKDAHAIRTEWSKFAALQKHYEKEGTAYEHGFKRAMQLENEETDTFEDIQDIFTDDFTSGLKSAQEAPEPRSDVLYNVAKDTTDATASGLGLAQKGIVNVADKATAMVPGLPKVDVAGALAAPKERQAKSTAGKMKNLQRQLILEELMVTDPVLKGEDPDAVSRAYQTLIQIAPDVSLNREVARSVLRQSVQSVAVSPYDAKSWADLESEIRKRLKAGSSVREEAR
jgi:hypothetical protein